MCHKIFFIFIMLSLLVGCGTTKYKPIDTFVDLSGGGYWDIKGPGKLYKVGYIGSINFFGRSKNQDEIEKKKLWQNIIHRSAELAQLAGKKYFVVYKNLAAAVKDSSNSIEVPKNLDVAGASYMLFIYILPVDAAEYNSFSVADILSKNQARGGHE